MRTASPRLTLIVSLVVILLVAIIQILSWVRDRRLQPGAFLLLVFALPAVLQAIKRGPRR
jgi:hypothetical protein